MGTQKANFRFNPRISTRSLLTGTAILAAAGILIWLCISISNSRNIQRSYTTARNQLGETVYQNLFMMIHRGDELSLTGTDVQGSVLPAMKEYFSIAAAMDTLLQESYGKRYAVLTAEQTAALRSAYEEYDAAFKGGRDTDQAYASLTAALAQTEAALAERYDAKGRIKPNP